MSFPITPRYFLSFRYSDTGLTPTFVYFKNAATLGAIAPPTITELSNGRYYFDYVFTTATDPDVVFQVDGGVSIPTEEVRYINGQLSPRDRYIDESTSQVKTDVWADNTAYAAGQKGKRVDDIGAAADTSATASLFGKSILYKEAIRGDSAGASDGKNELEVFNQIGTAGTATALAVTGAPAITLRTMAGAAFAGATDSLNAIATTVGALPAPDNASIAAILADTSVIGVVGDASGAATVFGQVYAARDSVKGADARSITDIAGAGFTTATQSLAAANVIMLRLAGMLHENSVLDGTSFDANNNLLTGRLRLYDSKVHADAAAAIAYPGVYNTGKHGEYLITATYMGINLLTYEVARTYP